MKCPAARDCNRPARTLCLAAILFIAAMSACDRAPADAASNVRPETASTSRPDAAHGYQRIISIAPNATEMIGAIGRAERLVAVSTFCIYPPEVEKLPRVGGLFDANLEMILRLNPDLIILRGENRAVQSLCEQNNIRIYRDQTNTFDDIYRTLTELGDLLNARAQADRVTADLRERLARIEKAVSSLSPPRVFITLSRNPDSISAVMTAGRNTFIDEVIRRAGGQNIFAAASLDYPQVSPESVLAAQPDVIIECMPEARVTDDVRDKVRRAWQQLGKTPASQHNRIFTIDAPNSLIPSQRIVGVVADVARLLHPEAKLDE